MDGNVSLVIFHTKVSFILLIHTSAFYHCAYNHIDDKPKLSQLYCLTRGCTRVQVIKSIAPKWIDLAMVMGYEHSDIESVNITTQRDPLNAARIILGQWLDGSENLCGPVTWSTLIEYLSIIEFQSLADKLNNVLLD